MSPPSLSNEQVQLLCKGASSALCLQLNCQKKRKENEKEKTEGTRNQCQPSTGVVFSTVCRVISWTETIQKKTKKNNFKLLFLAKILILLY